MTSAAVDGIGIGAAPPLLTLASDTTSYNPARWPLLERLTLAGSAAWVTAVLSLIWSPWRETIHSATTSDAAVFALAGDMIRRGGVPYVTFWDHKPPLIYLVNTLGFTISGGRIWGIWLVSLAALLAGLWLCHASMRRLWGAPAAILATLYVGFSLGNMMVADLPGGYALPLQWGAVALLASWVGGDERPFRFGLLLGALAAASLMLKPNQIGAQVAVAIALIVPLCARRAWSPLGRFVAGGLVASIAIIGAFLAYLASVGALHAFSDEVLRYNSIYTGFATNGQRVRSAIVGLTVATRSGSILLPAAGWILAVRLLWTRRRELATSAPIVLAIVWLPLEIGFATISGRPFPNYFAMLFAPLGYLAGVLAAELARGLRSVRTGDTTAQRSIAAPIAALCIALAVWAGGTTLMTIRDDDDSTRRAALVDSTVDYIRAHSRADQPIFVWGHAAELYLLSERRPASRFIYPLPLLTPGYGDSARVRAFLTELQTASPPLVIGVGGRGLEGENLTPRLDTWNPAWRIPSIGPPDNASGPAWWSTSPAIKQFYDYMADQYVLVGYMGGRWPIYRRRDQALASADGDRADASRWHLTSNFTSTSAVPQ